MILMIQKVESPKVNARHEGSRGRIKMEKCGHKVESGQHSKRTWLMLKLTLQYVYRGGHRDTSHRVS